MGEPILETIGLVKRFGAVTATDELSLAVESGTVHALIGPNGAGKTSAIAQLSGELAPDAGRIRFRQREITRLSTHARVHLGIARSYQVTSLFPKFTALENVSIAVESRSGISRHFWSSPGQALATRGRALEHLCRVGLERRADMMVGALAHGEQRQLEIAVALASEPLLLLPAEPMAGMGPEDSARVIDSLRPLKSTMAVLLVEHDMDAVFALADRITVMVNGRAIMTGSPEEIRANAAVRDAYLGGDL